VTDLNSFYSDGLEELRLLDVPNRFNVTLIAPSFHIEPWYGDHDTDMDRRLESFIVRDLVPFADSFAATGSIPERWVLGFSKSGFGALTLILRNPNVFSAAAAWDAPAQLTDTSTFGIEENFGSEENFDRYEIPGLVSANAEAFRTRNRLWISGDQSAWTSHMVELHSQMQQSCNTAHWVQGRISRSPWNSGWLEGAVQSWPPTRGRHRLSMQTLSVSSPQAPEALDSPRPGRSEIWVADAGWKQSEEINKIDDATDGIVENFGWPCYEGTGHKRIRKRWSELVRSAVCAARYHGALGHSRISIRSRGSCRYVPEPPPARSRDRFPTPGPRTRLLIVARSSFRIQHRNGYRGHGSRI
jgi:hypothetical protein